MELRITKITMQALSSGVSAAVLFSACFSSTVALAQESWSDSAPRIIEFNTSTCPLKVRGLSGEWANYRGSLKAGRKVMGAINPRRPDIMFFQLQRDSKFMFAAPRTCFAGEEMWNERVEKETWGVPEPKDTRKHFTMGMGFLRHGGTLKDSEGDETALNLKYTSVSAGIAWEKKQASTNWYFGGKAHAGLGLSGAAPVSENSNFTSDTKFGFHTMFAGTAYYSFNRQNFALGTEFFGGLIKGSYSSNVVGSAVNPSTHFLFGWNVGGRLEGDGWMLEPKLVFPKFNLTRLGVRLDFGIVLD